jgi:hypothetical protein
MLVAALLRRFSSYAPCEDDDALCTSDEEALRRT